jgi:hypothetical protein
MRHVTMDGPVDVPPKIACEQDRADRMDEANGEGHEAVEGSAFAPIGKRIRKVVPSPNRLSTSMSP